MFFIPLTIGCGHYFQQPENQKNYSTSFRRYFFEIYRKGLGPSCCEVFLKVYGSSHASNLAVVQRGFYLKFDLDNFARDGTLGQLYVLNALIAPLLFSLSGRPCIPLFLG